MPPSSALAAARADLADLLGDDARLFRFARRAALAVVPVMLAIVFGLAGTGPSPTRSWLGDILGMDFTQVWVAGRGALDGRAAQAYDLPVHLENLKAAFGPECRFAWHYPPVFLLPAAALAWLPPQPAFWLWSLLSLSVFAGSLRMAAGRSDAVLIGLAHPLVFCTLIYGQNAMLTAGLLTFGVVLVDRRPWVAGLCFGLVAYKPQLAALAPLLLLATGRWRPLAACGLTVAALCGLSLALFGPAPWWGFLGTLGETNRIILESAAAGLDINASAFGAVRLAGGPLAAAWVVQGAASLAALALAWQVWRACPKANLRAAALLAAAPMLSPYVPLYDLTPLVPATLFLVLHAARTGGLRGPERWLLLAAPLTALLRPAAATGIAFGFPLALATLACIALRSLPGIRPFPGTERQRPA